MRVALDLGSREVYVSTWILSIQSVSYIPDRECAYFFVVGNAVAVRRQEILNVARLSLRSRVKPTSGEKRWRASLSSQVSYLPVGNAVAYSESLTY